MAQKEAVPFGESLKLLRSIISEIEDELQGTSPDEPTTRAAPQAASPSSSSSSSSSSSTSAGAADVKPDSAAPKPASAQVAQATKPADVAAAPAPKQQQQRQQQQKKKQKQQAQQPKQQPTKAAIRDPFEEAALQVARVAVVERHPLYVCQVDLGHETRQLVTGLVKYYSEEELRDRLIVVITNLKASKLRGKESNAMLLAGDDNATSKQGLVKLLVPPQGAAVGDRVHLEGQQPSADPAACLNHKQWGKVVPEFSVVGGVATYKGTALVTKDGRITVSDLPDGSGIH